MAVTAISYNKKYRLEHRTTEPLTWTINKRPYQIIFHTLTVPKELMYLTGNRSLWGMQLMMSRLIKEIELKYRWCGSQCLNRLREFIPELSRNNKVRIVKVEGVCRFVIEGQSLELDEFLMCLKLAMSISKFCNTTIKKHVPFPASNV